MGRWTGLPDRCNGDCTAPASMRDCKRRARIFERLALRAGRDVRGRGGHHNRRGRSRHVGISRVGRLRGTATGRRRRLWQEPPRLNQCKQPVELANTAAAAVRTSSLFMNRTSSKDCISRRGGGSNNSTPLCVMCKRNVMFFCAINVADSAHDCRKHERPYEKYVAARGIGKADELSARTPSSPQASLPCDSSLISRRHSSRRSAPCVVPHAP